MSQPVKKEEKPKVEESTITIEKTNPAQYWLVKVPKELINQLQDGESDPAMLDALRSCK